MLILFSCSVDCLVKRILSQAISYDAKAKELAEEIENSFIPSQFENPANPQAHYTTTGPEIWEDADGQVDAFVAGAAKNKPCAVMTALSIGGQLSASMCLRGNERDREILEGFFTEFENNIKSL